MAVWQPSEGAAPAPESEVNLIDYTVTLNSKDDLDCFYNDMETEGGDITIPNRAVEVSLRRPISRNTRYWLTPEEAEQVKQDSRVLDVVPTAVLQMTKPLGVVSGTFNKSSTQNANHLNWGILRHTEETNPQTWGSDGTQDQTTSVFIPGSGKNVDVVIVDGHIDPDHPEFAVNADGTGGSRVVQYNWFQHDVGSGTGTYNYGTGDYGDNHGAHVAGTVAGNTYGWAPDANIYNIYIYGNTQGNGNIAADVYDYIRAWHAAKPINPDTGRRNPTIVNGSYGYVWDFANNPDLGSITSITYRGTTVTNAGGLTAQELIDGGIYATNSQPSVPFIPTAAAIDIADTLDDGIIIVGAAGNDSFRVVPDGDIDYNNTYSFTLQGTPRFDYQHRGSAPGCVPGVICVGALDTTTDLRKAFFSHSGTRIDAFAAGTYINSVVNDTSDNTGAGAVNDLRNPSYLVKKISGTSMASPQVCGMLACVAEIDPSMTPSQAMQYIHNSYSFDLMRDDGFGRGIADAEDSTGNMIDSLYSLQGTYHEIKVIPKLRVENGATFPTKTFKPRPTSGCAYPRVKIRRKG